MNSAEAVALRQLNDQAPRAWAETDAMGDAAVAGWVGNFISAIGSAVGSMSDRNAKTEVHAVNDEDVTDFMRALAARSDADA
jgi:hypothetical protein